MPRGVLITGDEKAKIKAALQARWIAFPFAEGPRVRIRLPPADSPCLAETGPLQVENRGFPAGVRRWVGGAVGRDAQALAGSARTGTDVSVGSYSSTAMVLTWSRAITGCAAQPSCCWAQLLNAKRS